MIANKKENISLSLPFRGAGGLHNLAPVLPFFPKKFLKKQLVL
jgi:hypothetical protein